MNPPASSDVCFNKGSVRTIKALHIVAKALSTPRLTEFIMSAFASVYGLALLIYGMDALATLKYVPGLISDDVSRSFGAVVMTLGLGGLMGLYRHARRVRMASALGLACLWGSIALHYMLSEPPIQTASVVHAFHSFMEACIFLRVYANLDQFWED